MATKQKTTTSRKKARKPSESESTLLENAENVVIHKPTTQRPWLIPAIIGVGLLIALGLFARQQLIVATVNGQPIYRHDMIRELEKQGGKQVLDQKITEKLIYDEAAKQNATVTDAEVDEEIATITQEVSTQGQDLDTLLAQQNMDRTQLREQIRFQKLVEKLIPTPAAPTEEEIATELQAQEAFFPEEMTEADRKAAITNQLSQQRLSMARETWMENLKNSANIQYLFQY